MHANAPEFSPTWRDAFDLRGARVVVRADHRTSTRMPNGGQISRMVTRGRPVRTVEHVEHEWVVTVDGRRIGTVRPNPNGTFSMSGDHAAHRTVRAAAEAPVLGASRALGVPVPDASRDAEAGGAEPPTP